jgi:predicted nucleotide-binding protein
MSPAVADKLKEFAVEVDGIDNEAWADRWAMRVHAFLTATLGAEAALEFEKLQAVDNNSFDTLAMRKGHLEGLVGRDAEEEHARALKAKAQIEISLTPEQLVGRVKVFVVHGHDNEAKESVARYIEKLGLESIILHEQPNGGRTVIEKFEVNSRGVAFAVVLLTPDDENFDRASGEVNWRARQNVILELGHFVGRLGRSRVAALHKGHVEIPTDFEGVVYIPMDDAGAWKTKLAQEFVEAKISIDLKGIGLKSS